MKKLLTIALLVFAHLLGTQAMAANQAPKQQPKPQAQVAATKWACPLCTWKNEATVSTCYACGSDRLVATEESKRSKAAVGSSSNVVTATGWACPACTLINDAKASKCTVCETKRPAASDEKKSKLEEARLRENAAAKAWKCPVCTFENQSGNTACEMCEAKRPVESGSVKRQKTTGTGDVGHQGGEKKRERVVVDLDAEEGETTKVAEKKVAVSASNNARWRCPGCDYENASTVGACPMCNTKKPDAIAVVKTASAQKAEKISRDTVCVNNEGEAAAFTVLSQMITTALGFNVDFRALVSDAIRLVGLVPGECYLLRKPASYETGCGSAAPYNEKKSFAITIQPDRLYAEYFVSKQPWSFGVLRMMLLHEASHLYQYIVLHQEVFEAIKQLSREEIVFERAADDMAAGCCGCWQCVRDWADYLGRMSPDDKKQPVDGQTAAFPGGLKDKNFYTVFGATSLDNADQIVTQENKQAMVTYILAGYEQVSNTVSLATGKAHPHHAERAVRSFIASARLRKSNPDALCVYHKQQQAQAMTKRLRTSAAATLAALSASSATAVTSGSLAAMYKGGSLGASLPAIAQMVPVDQIVVVPANQKSEQKEEHKAAHRSRNKRRFDDEALTALSGESIGSVGILPSLESPLACIICHHMISQGQKILKGTLGDANVPHALHADCKKEHTTCPCCKQALSSLEESVAL